MSVESDPLVARTGKRGPWHVLKPWRSDPIPWHRSECGSLMVAWRLAADHASSVGVEERRCKAAGCAATWAKIDAGKVKR